MNIETLTDQFAFLDRLDDSGSINMLFARRPLQERFGLDADVAQAVITGWRVTDERPLKPHERAAIYLRMVGA